VPQLLPRDLAWDGCLNVRELGGLPTRDGVETRRGAIVRADSVRQLSEDGWQSLVDHGIRTVVDLRGHDERAEDPPAEVPVEVVHVPFFESTEAEWEECRAELDAAVAAAPDAPTATRDVYLVFLERFRSNVAAAVRAVAHAPDGGVLVHCAGGKDRTGLLAAFLLHVAGVDDDEIAADYALSEERLRRGTRRGSRPPIAKRSSPGCGASRGRRRRRWRGCSRSSRLGTAVSMNICAPPG
jgi:protein-tyrosine phosphatase